MRWVVCLFLAGLGLAPAAATAQAPGTPVTPEALGSPDAPPDGNTSNSLSLPGQIPATADEVVTPPITGPTALDGPLEGLPTDPFAIDPDEPRDIQPTQPGRAQATLALPLEDVAEQPVEPDPGTTTGDVEEQHGPVQDLPNVAVAPPEDAPPELTASASPAATPGAAQELLTGLWRTAVASGETTHGFESWLTETLGGTIDINTTAPRPEIPADQAGRTRLASERWHARAGPVALGAAGRVVTTFGSAIPTAFCAPLTVCYIELEAGESLTDSPSVGDTVRWQVEVKTQGIGPETVLVEIKPSEDAEVTNLVIPTDRRLYTINLVNDQELHTPILSFLYPDSAARRAADREAAQAEREAQERAAEDQRTAQVAAEQAAELDRSGVRTEAGTVSAEGLNFGFKIDGKARFRPVRVFADGRRTYIDLHPDYRGAMPVIVAGPKEENAALNTRVTNDGTRLVADRVITDIWLQAGRQRVRIRRTGS